MVCHSSPDSISLSSSIISASSSISSSAQSAGSAVLTETSTSSIESPSSSPTPDEEALRVRKQIADDLKTWQEKFAKAASKGTEELDGRVKEITDRQIETQVNGVGEALVVQLEETTNGEYVKLRKSINKIVKSIPEGPSEKDIEKAQEEVAKAVRSSGQAVKSKAQVLRSWKLRFDNETEALVLAASDSTLEIIDSIRDLGLQKVGLRWAEIEGVTYDDWTNYHAVKKTFDKWRNEVEAVAKDHPGLLNAWSAAENTEEKGMEIAEDAAKELTRLKEVAVWKIQTADHSDDFSTKIMPAKVALAGQKVILGVSSISDSLVGSPTGEAESMIAQATEAVLGVVSDASSQVIGTQAGFAEQAASKASEAVRGSLAPVQEVIASSLSAKAGDVSNYISEALFSSSTPLKETISSATAKISEAMIGTPQPKAENVVSAASKKVNEAARVASEVIIGTPAPAYMSIASEVSQSVLSVSSAISDAISPSSAPLSETAASVASSVSASASSAASQASKKVFGGAMAQEVKERIPILDDFVNEDEDSTYSEQIQSIISQAGNSYADVTKAVAEALGLSTQTQGYIESATSIASDKYSSAFAAASKAIYGTQQGTGETVSSALSSRYSDGVAALVYLSSLLLQMLITTQGIVYHLWNSNPCHRVLCCASKLKILSSYKPGPRAVFTCHVHSLPANIWYPTTSACTGLCIYPECIFGFVGCSQQSSRLCH